MDASRERLRAWRDGRSDRPCWPITAVVLVLLPWFAAATSSAADFRTQNFIIMAPSTPLARQVGEAAEQFRKELAEYWLGKELPPWPTPCPVRVIAGDHLAAQGVTTYNRSPVRDFQMEVVGSPQRILDSVLPHEVTHTILATHFGRPLPRWADEGICTTVEHPSERRKHEQKLREFLSTRRGIAMNKLFLMTEYPSDVLPMYAQGYSVCQFMIAQQGPRQFVRFLGDYMQHPSWTDNVRKHYGYQSLAELQQSWLAWVAEGSGAVDRFVKQPAGQSDAAQVAASDSGSGDAGIRLAAADGRSPTASGPATRPGATTTPPPVDQTAAPKQAQATPWSDAQPRTSGQPEARVAAADRGWYQRQGAATPGSLPPPRPRGRHTMSQPQGEQGAAAGRVMPAAPIRAPRGDYRPGSIGQAGSYWR